jgi:hypothetical protein
MEEFKEQLNIIAKILESTTIVLSNMQKTNESTLLLIEVLIDRIQKLENNNIINTPKAN